MAEDLDVEIDVEVDTSELVSANAAVDAFKTKLESIDETVNIRLDVDTSGALAQVEQVHERIRDLEDAARNIKIDIDVGNAIAQIDLLTNQVRILEQTSRNIDIDVDTATATAQIAALQQQINNLNNGNPIIINSNGNGNNGPPVVDVNVQATEAIAELQRLEQRVHSLDNDDIFFNVDVEDASLELLRLRTLIRTLEQDVNINVDTTAAHAQLAALQAHLLTLINPPAPPSNNGGFFSNLFQSFSSLRGNPFISVVSGVIFTTIKISVLITVLQALSAAALVAVGVIGTLGVALGLLGSGALAFIGATGVALAGIGGVAAFVIPSIMALYDENAKLNKLQAETKTHIDSLRNAWGRFVADNQATALDLVSHGVNTLKTSLTMLEPVLTAGANAMDILLHNLNTSLQSERMTAFFDYLERSIPRMTEWMGNGFGNIGQGIANLMVAFEPLTNWMGEGFQNMMGRFADWSFNLQGSEKLMSFIEYIKTNLPTLGSALGDMTVGITNFFAGFGDTASTGIQWFSDKMKEFVEWSSNLDTNEGFQKMLADIETLAPKVGEAISLITDSVNGLIDSLANGGGMDKMLSFLEGVERTVSGENRIGKFLFGDHGVERPKNTNVVGLAFRGVTNHLFGQKNEATTLEDRGVTVRVNTKNVTSDLTKATKGPFDVGAQVNDLKPPMLLDPIDVPAQVNRIEPPTNGMLPPLEAPMRVNKVEPPPTGNLPAVEIGGRVSKIEPPPSGVLPPMALAGRVDRVETPAALPSLELAGRVRQIEPPSTTTLPTMEVPVAARPGSLASSIGIMPPVPVPAVVSDLSLNTVAVPPVDVPVTASSVDTSRIGPVRLPIMPDLNPAANFNWPPFPTFNWPAYPMFTFPALPTFNWPPMPVFAWPAYPVFSWPPMPAFSWPPLPAWSWPPMPTVNVRVSAPSGGNLPGYSTGLGRVKVPEMPVNVHKDEAILQADNANLLRSMGILKGEGRNPQIDVSAAASTSGVVTGGGSAPARSGGGVHVTMGDMHIHVNGGNTNAETAQNLRMEMNNWANEWGASLLALFPESLEG